MQRANSGRGRARLALRILNPLGLGLLVSATLMMSAGPAVGDGSTPPADGWYANVMVEGRKVPMIHVKDHGATVLVDTDGTKHPRTWAEQFRRRGDVPSGTYDIHKTHVTGSDNFEDDPIDRKGVWVIDGRGNITAR
jgi:hypothetical protein